jgi:hypothetical protein
MHNIIKASLIILAASTSALTIAPARADIALLSAQEDQAAIVSQLMLNEETVEISLREGFEKEFRRSLLADPSASALFSDNPELVARLVGELKPILQDLMIADLPMAQSQLAALLSAELSQKQLALAAAFLRTDSVQKAFQAGLATGATLGRDNPEYENALKGLNNDLIADLNPADAAIASDFVESGGALKIEALSPQIANIVEKWGAKVGIDSKQVVAAKTIEIMQDYFGAK